MTCSEAFQKLEVLGLHSNLNVGMTCHVEECLGHLQVTFPGLTYRGAETAHWIWGGGGGGAGNITRSGVLHHLLSHQESSIDRSGEQDNIFLCSCG